MCFQYSERRGLEHIYPYAIMRLLQIRVVLYLLSSPVSTPAIRFSRSLPQDFPNSRRATDSSSSFPKPQESVGFSSFDLRLHNNEKNPEFTHYHHPQEDRTEHEGSRSSTESPGTSTVQSPPSDPPKQVLPPPPITLTDTAWNRFREEWNRLSKLNHNKQLSLQDKLKFLSDFHQSETMASLAWPSVFAGSLLVIILTFCFSCCCLSRPVFCFGRQIRGVRQHQNTPHEPLSSMEMSPIIKTPITALTDDELDRLSFYLHRRQTRTEGIIRPDRPVPAQEI